MYYVVSPAYGRDYKNKKDVVQDWNDNKDFINDIRIPTGGGTYINKDDLQPGDNVELRYNRLQSACFVEGA